MPADVKIEVKTRAKVSAEGEAEMHLSFVWVPRGSGHKRKVREMAAHIRSRDDLRPHLKRLIVGTSKLTMILRPSLGLLAVINEIGRTRDVDGQLPLFA